MIKCPDCKSITITRNPSDSYTCHNCGKEWLPKNNIKEYKNGK